MLFIPVISTLLSNGSSSCWRRHALGLALRPERFAAHPDRAAQTALEQAGCFCLGISAEIRRREFAPGGGFACAICSSATRMS
jgi:hypothetical protein